MEAFWIIIPVAIAAIIAIRLGAGGMDRDRIRQYVEKQGGTFLDSSWEPFGPGWFGEKSDRIYGVRYIDRDGNEHQAHCKTSLWTGVYLTEDRIVRHSSEPTPGAGSVGSLEAENQRLREELARLKRERGGDSL